MHIAFLFRGYTLPDVHASSYTISYICLFGYLLADKVLTVLSLTPATWYEMDYICSLLRGMSNKYAVGQLLDFGCNIRFSYVFDRDVVDLAQPENVPKADLRLSGLPVYNRLFVPSHQLRDLLLRQFRIDPCSPKGDSELAHIFSFLSDIDSLSRDFRTILRLFFLQSFQPLMLTISEGRRL